MTKKEKEQKQLAIKQLNKILDLLPLEQVLRVLAFIEELYKI